MSKKEVEMRKKRDHHPIASRMGWGIVWGAGIFALSVLLGAAGHGIFTLLGLFSAPLSLLGSKVAWLSCIPMGGLLAALAPSKAFPILAFSQYLVGLAVTTSTDLADWHLLWKLPFEFALLFGIGLILYAAGHALLWRVWMGARKERSGAESSLVS